MPSSKTVAPLIGAMSPTGSEPARLLGEEEVEALVAKAAKDKKAAEEEESDE